MREVPGSNYAPILDDELSVDEHAARAATLRFQAMAAAPAAADLTHTHANSQPRWPTSHVLLPAVKTMAERVNILCGSLDKYDSGLLSASEACMVHEKEFPGRGYPRFLSGIDAKSRSGSSNMIVMHELLHSAQQQIRSWIFINESPGARLCEFLDNLQNSEAYIDSANCLSKFLEIQNTWAFRSVATSKKNNLDVHNALKVASKVLSMNRFRFTISFAARHLTSNSEFVTSVVLWLVCLEIDPVAWEVLISTRFWEWTEAQWVDCSKEYHEKWRKYGLINELGQLAEDASWTQLLYMHSLYGRGGIEIDWSHEFASKTKVPENILQYTGAGWSASLATETIRDTIDEVVSTAFPAAAPRSFDAFMDDAYEWLVSGSSAGIPSVLRRSKMRQLIIHEYKLFPRPTKRSVMEVIPRSRILDILLSEPKIVAKAHMKLNETGGKARAIYGVTLWHYIFSNWLLAPIELSLKHRNVDIGLPNIDFMELLLDRSDLAREGAFFSSYDYPDFNAMHTHAHMSMIYDSAKRHALESSRLHSMTDQDKDVIRVTFDWLRDATFRQIVLHPGTGKLVQTTGGLYSGNRDTTLINTLLNIAYARVVDNSLVAMNITPQVRLRLCHGDDIVSVFSNYPTAVAWNEVAGWCRLKGQENKLLTDQSYHEYLRVMGCRDGTLRGCLARCVATFVNGNWETDRVVGLDQKAQEIFSNISTMLRRGASERTCQELWYCSFHFFCKKVAVLKSIAESLWLQISGSNPSNTQTALQISLMQFPSPISYRGMDSFVSLPYLKNILKRLPTWVEVDRPDLRRMMDYLQQGTYGTELPVRYQDNRLLPNVGDLCQLSFVSTDRTIQQARMISFGLCRETIYSVAIQSRLKRRITALYTVLSCLRLNSSDLLAVLSTIAEADTKVIMQILDLEGLLRHSNVPDVHAAPELKALQSAYKWADLIDDKYKDSSESIEMYFTGSNFRHRRISDILRY